MPNLPLNVRHVIVKMEEKIGRLPDFTRLF